MTIATEILNQLGGNKFVAMTGAKNLMADNNSLQFKLPTKFAKNNINFVRVTLDPSDTYTVQFFNYRGLNLKKIEEASSVYCDQLQDIFTSVTGLDCTL
jgi:hypothetical protein